jgi:methylmalonyl-CoA/ethylmalonyl-CoA epimerase
VIDLSQLNFHHIGVACKDLDAETEKLKILGYSIEGDDFIDPIQGVKGRFLSGQVPRLELLVPLAGDSVLSPWLKSNVKMYHLAYETSSLLDTIQKLIAQRGRLVVKPVPAVAFNNREIAFVMLPNMLLVELISTV